MKTTSFAAFWAIFTVLVSLNGCTYTTENEEKVIEEQEAAQADAGALPDAAEGDGDVFKDKGGSGSKQLMRGVSTPTTILNETFFEKDGTSAASVYTLQFAVTSNPVPP